MNFIRKASIRFPIHFYSRTRTMSTAYIPTLPEKYLPPIHRNGTTLNKELFHKKVDLIAVFFPNSRRLQGFVKAYKSEFLNLRGTSNIAKDPTNPQRKVVLLNDKVTSVDLNSDNVQQNLASEAVNFLKESEAVLEPYELQLNYDFWRLEEILTATLPEDLLEEIPSSFTIVGHIAHFNLKENYLPYKHLIGQAVIDKNPKIKTVVNKTSSIGTEFRTFPMEVIAGEERFDVEQSELGCVFKFNFKNVYWNSRLQGEHNRLIETYFKKGEVVCDVMAGVGPFAVPAGRNKTMVMANDLNPESYKYLVHNSKSNRATDFVKCFNIDGAEMIKKSSQLLMDWYDEKEGKITYQLGSRSKKRRGQDSKKIETATETLEMPRYISHYVMNLPDSALTFLDNYVGIYSNETYKQFIKDKEFKLPYVHVYCFEKFSQDEVPVPTIEDLEGRVHKRINEIMQHTFEKSYLKFHLVRKVAPSKYMFCVSFILPEELAFK